MKLKPEEVQFDSASWGDPNGRLFHWDGNLYRAISHEMTPFYRKILQDRWMSRLFEMGLIETEIAPLSLEGYGLILKHRKIPFVSYGFEWCGAMLKDAALFTINFSLELAKMGLELQDANPWNILFEGSLPRFVDFCSIIPASDSQKWRPAAEFIKCFLNPLQLIAWGFEDRARTLMSDHTRWGVRTDEMLQIVDSPQNPKLQAHNIIKKLLRPRTRTAALHYLRQRVEQVRLKLQAHNIIKKLLRPRARTAVLYDLRRRVERVKIPIHKTAWSGYYNGFAELKPEQWTPKQNNVFELLSTLRPRSVLDIGSNKGWYSQLAARQGSQVIAFDTDETCITNLYRQTLNDGLPILPLAMNFCHPSPPYGPNREYPAATTRLRCEMVLALALVHHLVFKQALKFDEIVTSLGEFSEKWLLVEFVPREDRYVQEWYSAEFDWYNLENFIAALSNVFRKVDILESNRPPRKLLLCEK